MKTYVIADLHAGPGRDATAFCETISKAVKEKADIVLAGDCLEGARYSVDELLDCAFAYVKAPILSINKASKEVKVVVLEGNHDTLPFLKWLVGWELEPAISIQKTCVAQGVFITHGWEWDASLYWLRKLHIYNRMFPYFNRWDKLYCRVMSNTPGYILEKEDPPPIYWQHNVVMTSRALLEAIKLNMPVVFGHTHLVSEFELGGHSVYNPGAFFIDHTVAIIEEGQVRLEKVG